MAHKERVIMTKYVATSRARPKADKWVYHTSKSCPRIMGRGVREATENEIERKDMSLCKECSGETYRSRNQDRSIYEAAKNAEVDHVD